MTDMLLTLIVVLTALPSVALIKLANKVMKHTSISIMGGLIWTLVLAFTVGEVFKLQLTGGLLLWLPQVLIVSIPCTLFVNFVYGVVNVVNKHW